MIANKLYVLLYTAADLNNEIMKLVKTETQTYKKGEVYNLADGELNLPKLEYSKYFEGADDIEGEWMAMDRCKKTFKVVTKIYAKE